MEDLSYLSTPYAKMKEQECYDREYHEKTTGSGLPDTNRPDDEDSSMMGRGEQSPPTQTLGDEQ